MRHVHGHHDLVRPLAVDIVLLVNLDPLAHTGGLRGIGDGAEQHMRDRAGVCGRVPLDLDGVASLGGDGRHARGDLVAVDVACDVVAVHVCDGAVAWGLPDSDLVAWGDPVDPELVDVLVRSGYRSQRGDENNWKIHFGATRSLSRY